MGRLLTRSALVIAVLLQFSAAVYAGPLDDYYLQQFGEAKSEQLQKAVLAVDPTVQEAAKCGMPLKHGLKRDWNLLEQTTQKVLAKQLAAPVLTNPAAYSRPGGHFSVHYATTGSNAPPSADTNSNGVPDWVETVAETFENVYASYASMGYKPAPTINSAPYDIYLLDLAPQSFYGVTNSHLSASSANYPHSVSSWMELDNNFTDSIYKPATYPPLQSLQITAAHEYHHAVQYGYNYYFDVWYAEATSTWLEDELYDGVNQLYSYIPAWFTQSTLSLDTSESTTTGGGYGRWIFNRYMSEQHTPAMIRTVWEKVGEINSPDGNSDIPMAPLLESVLSSSYGSSLGNDFWGFTKRVYTRDWLTHTSEIGRIHSYSPVATYSLYPVNFTASSPVPTITLPHYSFAFYKFTPTSGVTSLAISISKSSGIQSTLFKNGTEILSDSTGNSYTANGLRTSDELILLLANTTNLDGHSANFSTDGSLVAVTEPTSSPSSPSTSTGSGCFIATAAYGSYLHPQVQLLRNFRDDFLLTNAPGRTFVALYYRCSPPLADLIARHPLLRAITRLALTPFVVAIVHPLIAAVSLLLLIGTTTLWRKHNKAACLNRNRHHIHTPSTAI